MTRRLVNNPGSEQPARPKPGDVLGGKYRIERELGAGGMGVVFEVTHLVMRTRRAVKWLLPLDDDEDAARRIRREARISGAIRHPHVVEVYDVNFDETGSYMVMELLDGENLASRIARTGPLPASEACTIIRQCLSGVAAAHTAGVVHRDLKPANIFLCRTQDPGTAHPKVLDFGVSRVLKVSDNSDTTHTRNAVIGTPAYMAPEQLRAQSCDARTDVYGMGVTLFEALAGRRAFDAESEADLLVSIVTGAAPPLAQRVPSLPAQLGEVVARAMHKDIERRYPSAEAFAEALAVFTEAASTPAVARNAAPPTARPGAYKRWLAAAAFLAAAATLVWYLQDHAAPSPVAEPAAPDGTLPRPMLVEGTRHDIAPPPSAAPAQADVALGAPPAADARAPDAAQTRVVDTAASDQGKHEQNMQPSSSVPVEASRTKPAARKPRPTKSLQPSAESKPITAPDVKPPDMKPAAEPQPSAPSTPKWEGPRPKPNLQLRKL